MSIDPYNDDGVVNADTMFFGRRDTLGKIYRECSKQPPVSVSLLGMRKSGKSTILSYLQSPETQQDLNFRESLRRYIFVYLDMEHYVGNTAEDFFHKAGECLLQKTPPSLQLQVTTNQATGNHGKNQRRFTTLLRELRKQQYHTVLLIDSFDKFIGEIPVSPLFFAVLRSFATEEEVGYVTASTRQLHHIVPKSASSPFFEGFTHVPVGPLEEKDADRLISALLTRSRQSFRLDEVAWIRKQGGRHPFFLKRICHHFCSQKEQQSGEIIDLSKVRQNSYDDLKPHFHDIWQDLSLEKQKQLSQNRQRPAPQRRIPELSESELFLWYISDEHKRA